jgi:hypothetical protein
MTHGRFVTVINCMDGRTQIPANEWMRAEFGAEYVDTITDPGPDGILANSREDELASIKKRVLISVNGHGSGTIALVGHHDCAGNPGPKEQHLDEVEKGCRRLMGWGLSVRIIGLWIGPDWNVVRTFDSEG